MEIRGSNEIKAFTKFVLFYCFPKIKILTPLQYFGGMQGGG
jgi:hypothetical protein